MVRGLQNRCLGSVSISSRSVSVANRHSNVGCYYDVGVQEESVGDLSAETHLASRTNQLHAIPLTRSTRFLPRFLLLLFPLSFTFFSPLQPRVNVFRRPSVLRHPTDILVLLSRSQSHIRVCSMPWDVLGRPCIPQLTGRLYST